MAITYPISDNDRFTVYDVNTNSPVKNSLGQPMTNMVWGSNDKTQMIKNLSSNIKWLIEVKNQKPSYDYWTQKLQTVINYDVANETATYSYNVVNLSQEEIDAITPDYYDYDGIKIGVSDSDQSAFANFLVLIDASGMAETDMIIIKDIYKNSHAMPVSEYRGFSVQYGLHCYSIFNS